jgi:hypothetical protein
LEQSVFEAHSMQVLRAHTCLRSVRVAQSGLPAHWTHTLLEHTGLSPEHPPLAVHCTQVLEPVLHFGVEPEQ